MSMRVISDTQILRRSSQVGLLVGLLCCALANSVCGQSLDAYFAKAIWTGDSEPIPDGVLVVRDGVIVDVGPRDSVKVPRRAKRHELGSATLIPGLVIAQTNIVESTRSEEYAISPEVRAVDGFDPFGDYQSLLAAGVTTIQISPGGDRLMPGQGGVVKLAGEEPSRQVLAESESFRIVLTQQALSPPTVYEPPVGAVSVERPVEPTKPQLATSLAQAVVGLEALLAEAAEMESSEDLRLLALSQILKSKLVSRWSAESNSEIQAALRLAAQFDLPWILVDPVEIDLLVERDIWKSELARGIILNPELRPGRITNPVVPREDAKVELPVWKRARQLVDAGAGERLALRPASDQDLKTLLYSASVMGRGGLSTLQILKMLTSNPARMLGVSDRVGCLKPKLDADFVMLSGAPFDSGTKLLATYANGERVFESEANNESAIVIHAGQVYTAGGILRSSSVAVVGGKIAGLGHDVSLPQGARIRDFGDAVIVPGMIDCSTSLGLGGSLSENTPLGTSLGDLLARDDDQVALGRQGGVTTAFMSSTSLPSPVLAFKLTDSPRPLKDPVALRFEVKGNLTATEVSLERTLKSGKAYADTWAKYDTDYAEYKKQLEKYEQEKAKYDAAVKAAEAKKAAEAQKAEEEKKKRESSTNKEADPKEQPVESGSGDKGSEGNAGGAEKASEKNTTEKSATGKENSDNEGKSSAAGDTEKLEEPKKPTEPKKPGSNANLEPYRDLFARKIVAMVDVSDIKGVDLAVKLFRTDFDLKTAIVASEAAARKSQMLAENDVFVVVGPTLVGTDEEGALVNYAAELAIARVPIGFQSNASTGVSELPAAISYAVYEGLGSTDALQGLTSKPANFFGLDSVGAIEIGNDADLVVLSGSPLLLSTEVLAVMIDGEWVFEKESK